MNVVVAPNAFKGCLTADAAAAAIADGIRRVASNASITSVPVADGGDGTVAAVERSVGGRRVRLDVSGPLGAPVTAEYLLLEDGATALIELAAASGLSLVPAGHRDPGAATSRGTGELIADALSRGARRIIVGVGGSACNDGGAGIGAALGYRFLDASGETLEAVTGATLDRVATIETGSRHPALDGVDCVVAADVANPLLGPRGCAAVFAPQKGATPAVVDTLERNMAHFADVLETRFGAGLRDLDGAGAAGGVGAGLAAFADARIARGIDVVIELTGLARHVAGADLVITGEGRFDAQTRYGKAPIGVAELAQRHGVPAVVIAGAVGPGIDWAYDHGVSAVESAITDAMTLEAAMADAPRLLADAAERVCRLLDVGRLLAG